MPFGTDIDGLNSEVVFVLAGSHRRFYCILKLYSSLLTDYDSSLFLPQI